VQKEHSLNLFIENKWIFFILILFIGIITPFQPALPILFILLFYSFYLFSKSITTLFSYFIFLLILQPTIFYNLQYFGGSRAIASIVNRSDEIIGMFMLVLLIIKRFEYNRWEIRLTGFEFSVIIFVLWGLITMLINGLNIIWSLISIFLTMKGFFYYLLGKNLEVSEGKIEEHFNRLVKFLLIIFFIGFLQYIGLPLPFLPTVERFGIRAATSVFGHHAYFGLVMGMTYAISIGIYLGTRKKIWLLYSFLFMLGVIMSSVRKSLVGLILGTLFTLLFYRKLKIDKKDIYYGIAIILIIFVAFYGRIVALVKGTDKEYVKDVGANRRILLYYGAYKILKNKPITGEGPGRYGTYVSVVTKSDVYIKYGVEMEDMYKVDTFWAAIAGEYGIPGIILMLFYLFSFFRNILKMVNSDIKNNFIRGLVIGHLILFVDILIESSTLGLFNLSLPVYYLFGGTALIDNFIFKYSHKSDEFYKEKI